MHTAQCTRTVAWTARKLIFAYSRFYGENGYNSLGLVLLLQKSLILNNFWALGNTFKQIKIVWIFKKSKKLGSPLALKQTFW